jgi:hypothetical protein
VEWPSCGDAATWFGSAGTWIGSVGTWFVGLVAAFIAWRQFSHGRFKPTVRAFRDTAGRIVVIVTNEGAGAGHVDDIDLLVARKQPPNTPKVGYYWEIANERAANVRPVPFALPGMTTARAVLILDDPDDLTDDVHVRVTYGSGRRSDPEKLIRSRGRIYGSTSLPGIQLTGDQADPSARPKGAAARDRTSVVRVYRREVRSVVIVRPPSGPTSADQQPTEDR